MRAAARTLVVWCADWPDERTFEPVVAAVETCTTGVEVVRPGVCAFATRGPSRYFGGDDALAAHVRGLVPFASVGIADGLFAATLAARGAVVVAPGETPAFLAPLPVTTLDRPELADLLRRLGIRTLGDLAALPPEAVLARFGADGLSAHRLARGLAERPPIGRVPPPDLAVSLELDPPAERVDEAAFAARALAAQLHDELAARGLACSRVLVEVETEHGERRARVWRHEGALSAAALAERVRWQLDAWVAHGSTTATTGTTGGLTLVRLSPEEVHADDGRQLGFWGGDRALDERAARALVRVQGLLGLDAVVTAVVTGGRDPADQVRLVPWGDPRDERGARGARQDDGPWPGRVPPPSPALVHHHDELDGLTAEVVDDDGQPVAVTGRGVATAEPARLSVDGGAWHDIAGWAGPWPVDERWWHPPAHRRRARWQVVTTDGRAHLLAVHGGRWLVEATYD